MVFNIFKVYSYDTHELNVAVDYETHGKDVAKYKNTDVKRNDIESSFSPFNTARCQTGFESVMRPTEKRNSCPEEGYQGTAKNCHTCCLEVHISDSHWLVDYIKPVEYVNTISSDSLKDKLGD